MRTVTYNAGAYFVEELQGANIVARFLHDGGDIILFETTHGEQISVHFIESSIEAYEIQHIVRGNDRAGIYTLFLLWGDRMLPGSGTHGPISEWLSALASLYQGRVYAYDIYGSEIFIFPVYFDASGDSYGISGEVRGAYNPRGAHNVRYGTTVHIGHLNARTLGVHRIAWFEADSHQTPRRHIHAWTQFQTYFELLGVDFDDSADAVKKAYRLLARRYHPDINAAPEATRHMQAINEAYAVIMALLDAST